MKYSHSKYVYRGDVERRRTRNRRVMLLVVAIAASTVAWKVRAPSDANAEPTPDASSFSFGIGEGARLREELETARGELDLTKAQLERANKVIAFSSRYGITADMARCHCGSASATATMRLIAITIV